MKPLHLLPLLVLLVATDAFKVNDQVKRLGKRYVFSVLYSLPQRFRFDSMTDADIEFARNESAQLVANHLQRQSSIHNNGYEESADIMYALMSGGFKGGICGVKGLGYYQMAQYWKKQRVDYMKNDGEPVTWRLMNTNQERASNTFLVSFKTHHAMGYSATPTYIVQMELLGSHQFSNYTITEVTEVGACTEKGTIVMSETDIYVSLQQFDPKNVEMKDKVLKNLQERQFLVNDGESKISREWWSMAAPEDLFEGSVCHGETDEKYTRKEMFQWWKRFMIMYHRDTTDKENTQVQLIGGDTERYLVRTTMKVQLGTKLDTSIRAIETFDFKIQVSYNSDKYWWIDKFQVMCNPTPTTKDEMQKNQANAYREILGERIQQMIDIPEMWYTATSSFHDLISPNGAEFESCANPNPEEMEKSDSLGALEHKFWIENKATVGKMEGFDAEDASSMTYIGDKMAVDMWIIWTPLSDNEVHESEWKFKLEWDERLQFFHVIKIIFGCPKTGKGNKSFSSLRDHLGG